jgi:hypothetical protein
MLEFVSWSPFFRHLAKEFPQVALNIEMLFENKLAVDSHYHEPKQFVLAYNNLLGSLSLFVNTMTTLNCKPLKSATDGFVSALAEEYTILRRLRDLSAHQKLVVPQEAFAVGLYRIQSGTEYILKIGLGQLDRPIAVREAFFMKNTRDVFHQLLLLHFLTFIDLEHAVLGECLGITRKWYYKVDYKWNGRTVKRVVDIYDMATSFTTKLMDCACAAYAEYRSLRTPKPFFCRLPPYNFVNTLLEIDLYPNLFSQWWGDNVEPSGFGSLIDYEIRRRIENQLGTYQDEYARLSTDLDAYRKNIDRFSNLDHTVLERPAEFDQFLGFIHLHHWHLMRVLNPMNVVKRKLQIGLLMDLGDYARELLNRPRPLSKPVDSRWLDSQLKKVGKQLQLIQAEVLRLSNPDDVPS